MASPDKVAQLAKCPTGIRGLDEITNGGLPMGRPSLVCGNAGCGKTIVGMEFLLHGALEYNEPGVFISFEETAEELAHNFASLGFDLSDLAARGLLSVDYVSIERSEIEETGEYDLEGLFIRLGYAIDAIGAKRVVLDTIEVLFAGLSNTGIYRSRFATSMLISLVRFDIPAYNWPDEFPPSATQREKLFAGPANSSTSGNCFGRSIFTTACA